MLSIQSAIGSDLIIDTAAYIIRLTLADCLNKQYISYIEVCKGLEVAGQSNKPEAS